MKHYLFIGLFRVRWKTDESKCRLRAARQSLFVATMSLFLLAAILVPHAAHATVQRFTINNVPKSASAVSIVHSNMASRPSFPRPLQSVNDSQDTDQPIQVGAWGDSDSVGNSGVQVQIETNSYNVTGHAENAFWVGDVLRDGSFIQFGYVLLSPGYYCLTAHMTTGGTPCSSIDDNVTFSDARWFWAYFPNIRDVTNWYYGFGPANSAGRNGASHLYSIVPSALGDWNFVLDGVTVYSSSFPSATSISPAHLVAEKASGPNLSRLGPVEFRSLAYLANSSVWHATSSLTPILGCGYATKSSCTAAGYGVESLGANDVLAGSDVSSPGPGELIWQRQSACSLNTKLTSAGSVGVAPLNVTFTDSVSSPQGGFNTDWWFGDGSHEGGNSSRTVTYRTPGNYTPFVRVLDSAACLSEASGQVSVSPANSPTVGSPADGTPSVVVEQVALCTVAQRNGDAPCQ